MVPTRQRHLIFILFLLVLSAATVMAGGQQEDPIRLARELVSENRINEAILLLEETVRNDPERIVEAEALMRTIREIRGEYNVLFEQLIDNLVNNPDDIERTLAIIDQMEALDEFPNERVVEQVQDARVVAQLAFDRNIVGREMDLARIDLERGDFIAAVERYLGLRNLQRAQFEARGYGDIFVSQVNEITAELVRVAQDFTEALPSYQQSGAAVLAIAARDVLDIDETQITAFFSSAETISNDLTLINEVAGDLAQARSQVGLQFPDDQVDWYLSFQDIITRGRSAFRGEEGIQYAIEQAYRQTIGQLAEAGELQTLELMAAAEADSSRDEWQTAGERYLTAEQTALLWERAISVEAGIFDPDPTLERIEGDVSTENAQPIIVARAYRLAASSLAELTTVMDPFVANSVDRSATLFSLTSQKAATQSTVNTLRNGRDLFGVTVEPLNATNERIGATTATEIIAAVERSWTAAETRAVARERDLTVAISQTQTDGVGEVIEVARAEIAAAEPLVDGVEEVVDAENDVTRVVRFPEEAVVEFSQTAELLAEAREQVTVALTDLTQEPPYVTSGPAVGAETARVNALAAELAALENDVTSGIEQAESLIAQAEALRAEAFARAADTRAAISAFQVDAARNNFDALREAFFESLALRENDERRAEADNLIQQVGAELQEFENVIVVRRVRELLTQADALYNQDEFVAARDTLLAAQQTWEQTNVESNPEIDRLQRLVTAALSLEEGRELAFTDPLYPILSNYLSIAREDYNRGLQLYESGAAQRAEPFFDRAIENLRNVRDVRPLNWDARILELRIAQIRNADDFDTVFAARYEQAVNRLPEVGPLEVYSELEVLAEINPDYPGIQEQIRQLEIALNLRPDPVNQARIAQAATLLGRARSLAQGGRDQALVAISLLEQAVELNPGNSAATFLLDQLRVQLGGQATVALSNDDEQQYRRAETLFSQGRDLQALAVVERLLSNADNQGYPPLVELRRRIALRLGI